MTQIVMKEDPLITFIFKTFAYMDIPVVSELSFFSVTCLIPAFTKFSVNIN